MVGSGWLRLFALTTTSVLLIFGASECNSKSSGDCDENGVAVEFSRKVVVSGKVAVSGKVEVRVYYESLCPYCRNFIVGPLSMALQTDLFTIVNLKLIPWGNALLLPNQTIVCQHGEEECYLNTIHACAINIWPDLKKHFNFIKCIEKSSESDKNGEEEASSWKACAHQLGLPSKPIEDCFNSGHGRQLLLKYGKETESLNPPRQYVPWVLVNNVPLRNDYMNFVAQICKAYKGISLPKACASHATKFNSEG